MEDLLWHIQSNIVYVNIYWDEIQSRECPYTKDLWHYVGIVIERTDFPLIDDIIRIRFKDNFDKSSKYFEKNNQKIHWADIRSADAKNVCKRWFEYILTPKESYKQFYSYILGINSSLLNMDEFNSKQAFNSTYNRFFRTAVTYALKKFFSGKSIVVKNIFHEEGQQEWCNYFPWHSVFKIAKEQSSISFECDKIIFLPKDHKLDNRSNIIQLCDVFLWVCTSIIHGIEESNRSEYRKELVDMMLPLVQRVMENPNNPGSSYKYINRIGIGFFPKKSTKIWDIERLQNQFYTERKMFYKEQMSPYKEQSLF
jgi:hypothetical protein